MDSIFGDYISIYTRREAIADGALIDVSWAAKHCGIKYPVAITAKIEHELREIPLLFKTQTYERRLVALLSDFVINAKKASGSEFIMKADLNRIGGRTIYEVKCVCEPGDDREPVITIMEVNED